jgi:hypothetical protein
MRRSEREITDKNEIEKFISEEHILRVAFNDGADIYIVPVNYGYVREDDKYSFYFHGAKAGRKYELCKCEPLVGFEIDGKYKLLEGEKACDFSAAFQSVIGTGKIRIEEDKDEKKKGLDAIMRQAVQKSKWSYDDKMIEAVAVFKLDVDKMSCKLH